MEIENFHFQMKFAYKLSLSDEICFYEICLDLMPTGHICVVEPIKFLVEQFIKSIPFRDLLRPWPTLVRQARVL